MGTKRRSTKRQKEELASLEQRRAAFRARMDKIMSRKTPGRKSNAERANEAYLNADKPIEKADHDFGKLESAADLRRKVKKI